MQAPAPVLAGNLSPRERKQVAADAPADAASLFPQAAIAEVQRQRIVQMHCGEIDLPRLNAMLAIQHGRDRRMAQVLDAAPAPRLLFAGVLHTLKSQGAPQYLRHGARDPGLKVLVLGEEGQAPAVQDADFVWLLPSQDGDGVALAPAAASCRVLPPGAAHRSSTRSTRFSCSALSNPMISKGSRIFPAIVRHG